MSKTHDYKPGNPEYDFWNDKNLYPSLRNDADYPTPSTRSTQAPEDHKTSFGTVFLVAFLWLLILAPFAFFFTWQDGIVQFFFWSGVILIIITYALAFKNAYQAEKRKKK